MAFYYDEQVIVAKRNNNKVSLGANVKLSDNCDNLMRFDGKYVYGIFIKKGRLIFLVDKYGNLLNGIYVWIFVKIWKC